MPSCCARRLNGEACLTINLFQELRASLMKPMLGSSSSGLLMSLSLVFQKDVISFNCSGAHETTPPLPRVLEADHKHFLCLEGYPRPLGLRSSLYAARLLAHP